MIVKSSFLSFNCHKCLLSYIYIYRVEHFGLTPTKHSWRRKYIHTRTKGETVERLKRNKRNLKRPVTTRLRNKSLNEVQTETYADFLKRHIRAKLDPPKSNNNTTKPLRPREPESEKQRTSQTGNKEPRDYRPPQTQQSNRRTERTWYNQRDRQPRYRQQREGRRQQPQGRYFLTRGQFSRNRYKN